MDNLIDTYDRWTKITHALESDDPSERDIAVAYVLSQYPADTGLGLEDSSEKLEYAKTVAKKVAKATWATIKSVAGTTGRILNASYTSYEAKLGKLEKALNAIDLEKDLPSKFESKQVGAINENKDITLAQWIKIVNEQKVQTAKIRAGVKPLEDLSANYHGQSYKDLNGVFSEAGFKPMSSADVRAIGGAWAALHFANSDILAIKVVGSSSRLIIYPSKGKYVTKKASVKPTTVSKITRSDIESLLKVIRAQHKYMVETARDFRAILGFINKNAEAMRSSDISPKELIYVKGVYSGYQVLTAGYRDAVLTSLLSMVSVIQSINAKPTE